MTLRKVFIFYGVLVAISNVGMATEQAPWDQWARSNPPWVEPIKPFNVIANIHYVGTKGLGSYLITSADGHVLIDGGLPQNAKQIMANIETLGFELDDIKILLNSHAHFDHSGGLSEIKRVTGAQMIASKGDREALETGLYPGSINPLYSAPPVTVDQVVTDGQEVMQSDTRMVANIMPGHTPGCTSWSTTVKEQDVSYKVLFFCSATVAGNRLVGPPQYEGIVDDYRRTFELAKQHKPDVFLSFHPFHFDSKLADKIAKRNSGDALAFVDKELFPALMQTQEQAFEKSLQKQKAKLESASSDPSGGEGAQQDKSE